MNWKVKGLVQKALSVVPGGGALNDILQFKAGALRNFDANVDDKIVQDWLVTMAYLDGLGIGVRDKEILEIGAGWYPTLPFCYSLAGAARVLTLDIDRKLKPDLTFRMVARLQAHLPAIAEAARLSLAEVQQAYGRLKGAASLDQLLARARVSYQAPGDAGSTGLPTSSIDLVYSNSVFEHIPRPALVQILLESRRILRPGGVIVHSIACNDHYASIDPAISPVNYLQYTEEQWQFWNTRFCYQNRLRAPDFVNLVRDAGYEVLYSRTHTSPDTLAALRNLKVAPPFQHVDTRELAVTSLELVARPQA
jgi:SAM-dependent methyltransferase